MSDSKTKQIDNNIKLAQDYVIFHSGAPGQFHMSDLAFGAKIDHDSVTGGWTIATARLDFAASAWFIDKAEFRALDWEQRVRILCLGWDNLPLGHVRFTLTPSEQKVAEMFTEVKAGCFPSTEHLRQAREKIIACCVRRDEVIQAPGMSAGVHTELLNWPMPKLQLRALIGAHLLSRAGHPLLDYPSKNAAPTRGLAVVLDALDKHLVADVSRLIWEYTPDLVIRDPPVETFFAHNYDGASDEVDGRMEDSARMHMDREGLSRHGNMRWMEWFIVYLINTHDEFHQWFYSHDVAAAPTPLCFGSRRHPVTGEWLLAIAAYAQCTDAPMDANAHNRGIGSCALFICPACARFRFVRNCHYHQPREAFPRGSERVRRACASAEAKDPSTKPLPPVERFMHELWCPGIRGIVPRPKRYGMDVMSPSFDPPSAWVINDRLALTLGGSCFHVETLYESEERPLL